MSEKGIEQLAFQSATTSNSNKKISVLGSRPYRKAGSETR